MNKKQDSNLTAEQKFILHEEGTEQPGTSPLNNEKREGSYYCVGCGTKLFESNTKYESGSGWPSFFNLYQMFLRQKQIITQVMQEQNIIVKNVVDITDIFLMMAQNLHVRGFATMELV